MTGNVRDSLAKSTQKSARGDGICFKDLIRVVTLYVIYESRQSVRVISEYMYSKPTINLT